MVGIRGRRRPVVLALETLGVAAGYYAAGRLGLLRGLVVDQALVTPIWPPTGVALACLLILGLRAAPGIALGALCVVLSLSAPGLSTIGVVAGNTAAPVCAYLMLRRAGFCEDLARLRDGLALVFLGALTGMVISACTGVALLLAAGKVDTGSLLPVWLAWWVGDAMGVVLVTPLLLVLHRARRASLREVRWKESGGLAVVACVLVPLATQSTLDVQFLVYPLLIWAALRFQLAGSILCALLASVLATLAATDGRGPFTGLTEAEVMMKLQAFNGTMALTALLLSAVIAEQRSTRKSVERACLELAAALEHLTAGDSPPGRRPGGDGPPS